MIYNPMYVRFGRPLSTGFQGMEEVVFLFLQGLR